MLKISETESKFMEHLHALLLLWMEYIQDLAAASSSRKIAAGALLDISMSDNSSSSQSSNKHLRWIK